MSEWQHGKHCVTRLRSTTEGKSWPLPRLATELTQCCGISRLRAHRLARGWTLERAVEALRALCDEQGAAGPRVNVDQLRRWETNQRIRPRPSTIALLCRLYEATVPDLGLEVSEGVELGAIGSVRPAEGQTPKDHYVERLDDLRMDVDRTLAATSTTPERMDLLDESVLRHRQQYPIRPPHEMIKELAEDLREIQRLSAERQPARMQRRLSEMTAILTTLIGDAYMKLGNLRSARAWYATAMTAADDSGHRTLRARVRAQAAMLPYYYGPLASAVRLTSEARVLLQDRPSNTGAFVTAAEARARARIGDQEGAAEALRLAQHSFEGSRTPLVLDAWAFPEHRFLLYISGVLTSLGRVQQARKAQLQARALYARLPRGSIDPTLLDLEQALCLAQEGRPGEACKLTEEAYLQVPLEYRTEILGARARSVLDALPSQMRLTRQARELADLLSRPPAGPGIVRRARTLPT